MPSMATISSLYIFSPALNKTSLSSLPATLRFKKEASLRVKCSSSPNADSQGGISTYTWCAGLGALGFVETGYLTYIKYTNSAAFCPVGGGSCSDILNSDYAVVFGVPLPLIGMVAYGLVAALGLQLSRKNLLLGVGESNARLILLGTTTSMAAASSYFLYLLNTKFAGASCSYCLVSALLSFSLLFITLKELEWQEIREFAGLQLVVAAVVIAALNNSYSTQPVAQNLAEIDLLPIETEITTQSTPLALSLADHLRSIGAKMYGAFWCSHCLDQKKMFGQEAAKILDYVECFPDGVGKGRKMAEECKVAGIEGFPTWVIKGKVVNGEQTFLELMDASGFLEDDKST